MAEAVRKDPVQERAQITRDRLLSAAIRKFAALGYDTASTRQIEEEAGVKRGLINYHFGSKDALWKAAAGWLFERAAAELETVEAGAANVDPIARLRYFVRAYVRFSASYPEVNQLMVREGLDDDWRLDWLVENIVSPWYQRVRTVFVEAERLGVAPDMPFHHFYYVLVGAGALMFSMAGESKRLAGIDPRDESVVSAHADALAELLFPGGRE